jgi:hypothetical protein
VLRALRQIKQEVQRGDCPSAPEVLDRALEAIRALEIPHLEWEDSTDQVVH